MKFEQIIKNYITEHCLLQDDGMYIVALSGGPDSVALLRALHSLGYNIHAAHCNFHLRGKESDRDENFCKELCKSLNIQLHFVHFDTNSYAELHKVSIEMAARELRYHWFDQLNHDINADGVCIAHHQDDQVETVLLNIIRGTGLKGLLGMQAKNGIYLRPMLCVSEAQVMEYLKEIGQDYVIDSTNLQDDAQRNKLRLDIIPLLEKVNPAVKANIIRMTENLGDVEKIVCSSLEQAKLDVTEKTVANAEEPDAVRHNIINLNSVQHYPAPLTLLWSILSPYHFNRTQIEEIVKCTTDNKEWNSRDCIAIASRGKLYIVGKSIWNEPIISLRIPEPGLYRYGKMHIKINKEEISDNFIIPKTPNSIAINYSNIKFPLILRAAKPGDRFTPFGMKGSKLISDYLKDRHRDIISRHFQLVLTDGTGRILWLVNETIDNHCRIKAGITHEILSITFKPDDRYGEGIYQGSAFGIST